MGELPEGYSINEKRWVRLGIVPAVWSTVMFFSLLSLFELGLEVQG